MESSRFHAVKCRVIPSSFVAHCKGRERPVTIAANGTQFIYILDSCNLEYLVNAIVAITVLNFVATPTSAGFLLHFCRVL